MARRSRGVPKQSHTLRNPDGLTGSRAPSSNCWWTETGWLCCATQDVPWPKCIAGGVITPGSGGAVPDRRTPMRMTNPSDLVPVVASAAMAPAGGGSYVVAPQGAFPGATAWLYSGVAAPTLVQIDQIFNLQDGVYARVTPQISAVTPPHPFWWPSTTGGFQEALAPFSQGSSVRTTSGAPVRTANPVPRQSLTLRNPARGGYDNYAAGRVAASSLAASTCFVDLASLRLHCPGSALHGVVVTDVEGDGDGTEGELVAASYVDPTTGMETVGHFVVMADQGVPWWEHDGHCCESCALGEGCTDCEAA